MVRLSAEKTTAVRAPSRSVEPRHRLQSAGVERLLDPSRVYL